MTDKGADQGAEVLVPDDDYRKQVLARYEARRKVFTQRFSLLIIFGLGFVGFILAPLISLKLDAERVAAELQTKGETIDGLQQDNARILANQAKLQGERDILNGKLTSLQFVRAQTEEQAADAQAELTKLASKVQETGTEIAVLKERLEKLRAAEAGMNTALRRFDPDQRTRAFREWFGKMANAGRDRSTWDPACANSSGWQAYYVCEVRNKLQADWNEDFAVIRTNVVAPLQPSEPATARSIEDELVKVRGAFNDRLNANPGFWHTIDEKLQFMRLLSQEWKRAFDTITTVTRDRMAKIQDLARPLDRQIASLTEKRGTLQARLDDLNAKHQDIQKEQERGFAQAAEFERQQAALKDQAERKKAELERNQKELAELKARRADIVAQQGKIEARLKDFESPFGKLPLGLKEATLAFPFIIAAGFLVCALVLADLIGLRREYHDQSRAGLPGNPRTVRRRVAVTAPIWFDPAAQPWRATGALILFLHPVPIFVVVVWLIASGWLLPHETDQTGRFLTHFYEMLYIVGGLLLVVGIWRVLAEWLKYREAEAGAQQGSADAAA